MFRASCSMDVCNKTEIDWNANTIFTILPFPHDSSAASFTLPLPRISCPVPATDPIADVAVATLLSQLSFLQFCSRSADRDNSGQRNIDRKRDLCQNLPLNKVCVGIRGRSLAVVAPTTIYRFRRLHDAPTFPPSFLPPLHAVQLALSAAAAALH